MSEDATVRGSWGLRAGFEEERGDTQFHVICVCDQRHPRISAQWFRGRKVCLGLRLLVMGCSRAWAGGVMAWGPPSQRSKACLGASPLPGKAVTARSSLAEDGEAVSSSYESYDEEESSKGKSAPYQWPSPEASIELMRGRPHLRPSSGAEEVAGPVGQAAVRHQGHQAPGECPPSWEQDGGGPGCQALRAYYIRKFLLLPNLKLHQREP